MNQEVQKYLSAIQDGNDNQVQKSQQKLLQQANALNQKQQNLGSDTLVQQIGQYVDLPRFMDSLDDKQLGLIRQQIADQVDEDEEMAGGAVGSYSVLEIILGIIFFPWSLLYFIFVHPPTF